jgi:integrase
MAILNTAVSDGLIRRNPCQIKGAGQEESEERPVLSVVEVYALAESVEQRYRMFVLLGTFASLRWGELAALRRCDIDLEARTIRVSRQLTEQLSGGYDFGPTKSSAGRRIVVFPEMLVPEMEGHLKRFAGEEDDALVFTSPGGMRMRHSNFYRRVWLPAVSGAGLRGVHFHDLRHTGNTLFAGQGASLREMMERMGHGTTGAAVIYIHSTSERQRMLADRVGEAAAAVLREAAGRANGTLMARPGEQASR